MSNFIEKGQKHGNYTTLTLSFGSGSNILRAKPRKSNHCGPFVFAVPSVAFTNAATSTLSMNWQNYKSNKCEPWTQPANKTSHFFCIPNSVAIKIESIHEEINSCSTIHEGISLFLSPSSLGYNDLLSVPIFCYTSS